MASSGEPYVRAYLSTLLPTPALRELLVLAGLHGLA